MLTRSDAAKFPEIVFGLIAPLGTNLDVLYETLGRSLRSVGYKTKLIHSIELLPSYDKSWTIQQRIEQGTKSRSITKTPDLFSILAVREIQNLRRKEHLRLSKNGTVDSSVESGPLPKTAYVVRQLKRPEEAALLRRIYDRGVYLISAYSSYSKRKEILSSNIGGVMGQHTQEVESEVSQLLETDASEASAGGYGQMLRQTFPKADFFIDMDRRDTEVNAAINRFVELIFKDMHVPTADETNMFHAYAASLSSSDLSRQVGAAIAREDGTLLTVGVNEAPKVGGGFLRDEDNHLKGRDYDIGYDTGDYSKKEIFEDLIDAISDKDLVSKAADSLNRINEKVWDDLELRRSLLLDRVNLSRTVHAEMMAITTAARFGLSVQGCQLYTTTFPCHDCAKHIIASGIKLVRFVEPYPKSLAEDFYHNSINVESPREEGKLQFVPFMGVSPTRFIDLFSIVHPLTTLERKDKRTGSVITPPMFKKTPRFGVDPIVVEVREKLINDQYDDLIKKLKEI